MFSSNVFSATSESEAIDFLMARGMTDGLPVVAPTMDRVRDMLGDTELPGDTVLGTVPERRRVITVEKAAINAVMAGCTPELMPVVVAAVRAVCDPRFSVHGPTATTAGTAVLIIVNGPVVEQLGFNAGANLFGPGHRANATVGRALNLILRNVAGSREEEFDRACFGHPGKFTYCVAENEALSPWTPLHVQRGFEPSDSTVTVFAGEAPNQVRNSTGRTARAVLSTIAARISAPGSRGLGSDSELVVLLGQEHMNIIDRDGWDKDAIQAFIAEHAVTSLAALKRAGAVPEPLEAGDEGVAVPAVREPESVLVVAAGGAAGGWSCVVPGWTGRHSSRAVTLGIPGYARPAVCSLPLLNLEGE